MNPVMPRSFTRSAEHKRQEDEFQEDTVKEWLQKFLEAKGYKVAIAKGNAPGPDINACCEDKRWIIEVKGCGSRNAMWVNYFLTALGELLQRMNDPNAKYSLAFPDLGQFRRLWARLPGLAKERTGVTCLFVRANGEVDELDHASRDQEAGR